MFGILRLALAAIVVIYHAGFHPLKILIGASAVIVFYMISGYVMSALYYTKFGSIKYALRFYVERAVRIYPQYYFYLALTFLTFYCFNLWNPSYPQINLGMLHLIGNITLIPLKFENYLAFLVLPQSYSLLNEVLFYLLVPVIFLTIGSILAFLIGFTVFILASHNIINIELYSYYFLPGPVIFFLFGHFIHKRRWVLLAMGVLLLISNHLHLMYKNLDTSGFNQEIYIGLYMGLSLVFLLGNFSQNKLDNKLGAWSYGCFLVHMPLLKALTPYTASWNKLYLQILLLTLSVGSGALSHYFIEKPTIRYRRSWSNKNLTNSPHDKSHIYT